VALALALTHKTKRKMSPLGIENFQHEIIRLSISLTVAMP